MNITSLRVQQVLAQTIVLQIQQLQPVGHILEIMQERVQATGVVIEPLQPTTETVLHLEPIMVPTQE
jgi:hypothetical protein